MARPSLSLGESIPTGLPGTSAPQGIGAIFEYVFNPGEIAVTVTNVEVTALTASAGRGVAGPTDSYKTIANGCTGQQLTPFETCTVRLEQRRAAEELTAEGRFSLAISVLPDDPGDEPPALQVVSQRLPISDGDEVITPPEPELPPVIVDVPTETPTPDPETSEPVNTPEAPPTPDVDIQPEPTETNDPIPESTPDADPTVDPAPGGSDGDAQPGEDVVPVAPVEPPVGSGGVLPGISPEVPPVVVEPPEPSQVEETIPVPVIPEAPVLPEGQDQDGVG